MGRREKKIRKIGRVCHGVEARTRWPRLHRAPLLAIIKAYVLDATVLANQVPFPLLCRRTDRPANIPTWNYFSTCCSTSKLRYSQLPTRNYTSKIIHLFHIQHTIHFSSRFYVARINSSKINSIFRPPNFICLFDFSLQTRLQIYSSLHEK